MNALTAKVVAMLDILVRTLEPRGVVKVVVGFIGAAAKLAQHAVKRRPPDETSRRLRSNLGRGSRIGLEGLVWAGIIATFYAPLTAQSVLLLGAIFLIRTSFSFSVGTEIQDCFLWRRRDRDCKT